MKVGEERFFIIISLKIKLSNLFSIQHPGKRVLSWETIAECFVMVQIKSIHNIGYKTAFYTSLYLLLSDSNQNILISFSPKILISYHSWVLSMYKQSTEKSLDSSVFSKKYWINNNWNKVDFGKVWTKSATVIYMLENLTY